MLCFKCPMSMFAYIYLKKCLTRKRLPNFLTITYFPGEKGKKKGGRKGHSYSILRPTYTHEAIMKLQELGHIKYVISQNCDGLHRLSGIPESKISELHGNVFVQKCEKCETRYTFPRSYRVYREGANFPSKKCKRCHIDHRTGRKCEKKVK